MSSRLRLVNRLLICHPKTRRACLGFFHCLLIRSVNDRTHGHLLSTLASRALFPLEWSQRCVIRAYDIAQGIPLRLFSVLQYLQLLHSRTWREQPRNSNDVSMQKLGATSRPIEVQVRLVSRRNRMAGVGGSMALAFKRGGLTHPTTP